MFKTPLSASGPIAQTRQNADVFCLNLIYATACYGTVQAYQILEKAPATPANQADVKFYLETLFSKPLVSDA